VTDDDDQDRDARPGSRMDRAFRSTVGRESTAFGFSILMTVSFAMVQHHHGAPVPADIVRFALGAVASFTLLEAALSRGFRRAMPQHRTRVLALGTALNVISVGGGLAASALLASVLGTGAAWLLAPFAAATAYLVLESLETFAAERIEDAAWPEDAALVDE
jgi:hypothetical protein